MSSWPGKSAPKSAFRVLETVGPREPARSVRHHGFFPASGRMLAVTTQEEAAGLGTAADADGGDPHVLGDLALAGLAPELDAGLVQEAVAVQAATRQLAAVGVDRQFPVRGVVGGVVQERADLAVLAEAERLD